MARLLNWGVASKSSTPASFLAAFAIAMSAVAVSGTVAAAQTSTTRKIVDTRDSVATLSGVVTGIEIPATRIRLNVDGMISELPVSNLSQLLSGRFAGVQVLSPGATGMASRIRIRGQSSLMLDNEPLIIVDGVRLFKSFRAINRAFLSRVDDINVNEIATIDLLSGPAGTALYGDGSANGVVIITTKRGVAGKPRVSAYGEGGVITDPNEYPELYSLWGKRFPNPSSTMCTVSVVAAGACTVDSLTHGSVLGNDATTPIDRGYRTRYGAQVSGGASRFQYFVAAEREDETGVFKMPALEVQRIKAERGTNSIPDNQIRPSALTHNNFRANLSAQPFAWLSLDLSSGYVNGDARWITSEGNSSGIWANVLGGGWSPGATNPAGVPLSGYWLYPAGDIMSPTNDQTIDRYLNTIAAKLQPLSWLSARVSFAKDDATQNETFTTRPNEGPRFGTARSGGLSTSHTVLSNATLSASTTAEFRPAAWARSATTFGAQGIKTELSDTSEARAYPDGTTPPISGTLRTTRTIRSNTRFNSYYLTEALSLGERFFLSGGVRQETPTVYGPDADAVNHYNIGASWVVSRERFMKSSSWLNLLRLRSAYGTAGQSVSLVDQYASFALGQPTTPNNTTSFPFFSSPEMSAEFEAGFDAAMRSNTSQLSFTFYNKRTRDGFVRQLIPPASGAPSDLTANGVLIQNRGFELTLQQQLLDRQPISANIGVTTSRNRNRVLKFPAGSPPVFGGNRTTLKSLPGYPLFGIWNRTYTYSDANNDGVIVPGEMTFSDTAAYLGSSFPTNELALSPRIELFNHKLRFSAQIDSKWGFKQFNNTLRHQCQSALSCRAVADKTAPLVDQAAAVALSNSGVLSGFIEDGSFTRLREASVALSLPARWARAVRASEWNVVLTGRNLGVSTKYRGIDPEAVESNSDTNADEYFATPLMQYWTVKVNFRF